MMIARWVRTIPGRGGEYIAAVKSDLLPAIKKAELRSFSIWQVYFGEVRSQYLELVPLENWELFDKPDRIVAAMGQAAYDQFQHKTSATINELLLNTYRFRPELSYLPLNK